MQYAKTRSWRKRLIAAAAGVAISTLALAGCSGSAAGSATKASGPKTNIQFMYATGDETWNSVVAAVAKAFNAQSSTTTVTPVPLTGGSDYPTAMKTVDATGKWPAIIDMRDTATYIKAGKIAPIPSEVTGLLKPTAYAKAADGNVYTVPYSALNGELGINIVYNKDYFKKHRLSVPKTYDDFITLMKDIKANGDVPLATAASGVWPSDQLWKPLASPVFAKYSDQGGFWNAAKDGKTSIADLRAPLDELKTITDEYVLKGWQSTEDAQTTTLLVNGQAVMATSSAGLGRLMDINKVDPKFNAGLFIIPDAKGNINVLKNSVDGTTAGGLAISAQAKADKKQYASSVEFLKYFYSVPAANLMEKAGWISPDIADSAKVTRNDSIPGASDYFALLKNPKLVWYENAPTFTTFSAFNTFFRQSRIAMQDGQMSVDDTITKLQAEFDKDAAAG
ncbi:MAG: carbohydrate ABC transporter substrate-binding protein [Actinobacteria bacterium]|nr:carbohydrate ABC transporter substrate-binding protein [Actinomycetota bacterium]